MSLTRTPLAAISFNDASGTHIRVYYQAPNGDIKEAVFDEGSNWTVPPENTVGNGKLNTGLAAATWLDSDTGSWSISVYFLRGDSRLAERCSDGKGGWVDGYLTGEYQAAPYSKIAATPRRKSDNTLYEVLLCFQEPTNKIRPIVYSPTTKSWSNAPLLVGTGIAGTSISANALLTSKTPDEDLITIYYQNADFDWSNSSRLSGILYSDPALTAGVFPPGASITQGRWETPGLYAGRIVVVDENNQLCMFVNQRDVTPTNLGQEAITLSDVAMVSVASGSVPAPAFRLFFQKEAEGIAELASSDGDNWSLVTASILG